MRKTFAIAAGLLLGACLASPAQQHLAAVAQFAGDHGARRVKRDPGIGGSPMLCLTQQNIAADATLQPRLKAAVAVQQHHADSVVRTAMHERGREHDVTEADH